MLRSDKTENRDFELLKAAKCGKSSIWGKLMDNDKGWLGKVIRLPPAVSALIRVWPISGD